MCSAAGFRNDSPNIAQIGKGSVMLDGILLELVRKVDSTIGILPNLGRNEVKLERNSNELGRIESQKGRIEFELGRIKDQLVRKKVIW